MVELNKEQILGRLANQIHNPTPDTNQLPEAFVRFAVVQSVGGFRAVIKFAGSTVNVGNVRYLTSATFSASDTVAIIQYKVQNEETNYLIIGKVA